MSRLCDSVLLRTSIYFCFFFSSRRRHTRSKRDWSSDVCSSDLDGEQLDHDIQDGSCGECQECREDRLVLKGLTDDRPDERRTARDQAERSQETPAWEMRFAGEGPDDAEALRRVVEREPDDQDQGQTKLSASRGLADRETL